MKGNRRLGTADPEVKQSVYMDRRIFYGVVFVAFGYLRLVKGQAMQPMQDVESRVVLWPQFSLSLVSTSPQPHLRHRWQSVHFFPSHF